MKRSSTPVSRASFDWFFLRTLQLSDHHQKKQQQQQWKKNKNEIWTKEKDRLFLLFLLRNGAWNSAFVIVVASTSRGWIVTPIKHRGRLHRQLLKDWTLTGESGLIFTCSGRDRTTRSGRSQSLFESALVWGEAYVCWTSIQLRVVLYNTSGNRGGKRSAGHLPSRWASNDNSGVPDERLGRGWW